MQLLSELEPLGQHAGQTRFDDFLLRGGEVVFEATLLDYIFLRLVNAVCRAPIAVTRLSDTAGINKIFFRRLNNEMIGLHALHAIIAHEGAGDMSVAKKTNGGVLVGEAGGRIEIVKNVAPLIRRIERGVDDGEVAHLTRKTQGAQPFLVLVSEVRARPVDGGFGQRIEAARGIGQRRLFVMVTLDHGAFHFLHDLDAFVRVGVVADDIAQANKMRAVMRMRIREDGFRRFEISVEITEDGETHG